jgi:hypothetical protein
MSVEAQRSEWVERVVADEPETRVGALDDGVVDDEPAADARANRDHGEVGGAARGAEPVLRPRQRQHVVVQDCRQTRGLFEHQRKRHRVSPLQERRAQDDAVIGRLAAEAHPETGHARDFVRDGGHEVG